MAGIDERLRCLVKGAGLVNDVVGIVADDDTGGSGERCEVGERRAREGTAQGATAVSSGTHPTTSLSEAEADAEVEEDESEVEDDDSSLLLTEQARSFPSTSFQARTTPKRMCWTTGSLSKTSSRYILVKPVSTFDQVGTVDPIEWSSGEWFARAPFLSSWT